MVESNHPTRKIWVRIGLCPQIKGENEKYLETKAPTSSVVVFELAWSPKNKSSARPGTAKCCMAPSDQFTIFSQCCKCTSRTCFSNHHLAQVVALLEGYDLTETANWCITSTKRCVFLFSDWSMSNVETPSRWTFGSWGSERKIEKWCKLGRHFPFQLWWSSWAF